MRLSILIATIPQREAELKSLMEIITPNLTDDVQCLTACDNCIMSIGEKRNKLLEASSGDYVVFVDDDDIVPDYYVSEILKAVETSPDVVGIEGIITTRGVNPKVFKHSLQYDHWFEEDGIYYRNPNHLNPVKRDIALEVGFKCVRRCEDRIYSARIKDLLKTEVVIPKVMYYYQYNPSKSYSKGSV